MPEEGPPRIPAQATANEVRPKASSGRSAPRYLRAKRQVKRLYLIANGLLRSALSLTGWIVGFAVLVLLFREITTEQTVIQPISVPKSVAEDGLSSEVAARRLQDAMSALLFAASTAGGRDVKVSLRGDLPEIVVPTVGMSVSTLATYVRMFLRLPSRRSISGEVVASEKEASLTLRLNEREIYRSSKPIPFDRLDKLWPAAAEAVLRHISPYHVALFLYDTRPDEAVALADYLIRYYPATDENVAWAHIILGVRHLDYLRYKKARGEFENALAVAAKSRWGPLWMPFTRVPSYASVAQVTLGRMLLEQGEFKAAIDALNRAVRMDPNDPVARHNLGMARVGLNPKDAVGDFDEARRLLRKAIHDYNRQGGAANGEAILHVSLGYILQQQVQEGAEAEFKQATQLDPGNLEAPTAYCSLLYEKKTLAEVSEFENNHEFCISSLQQATRDVNSRMTLVDYLMARGKRSEAIEVLLSALKNDDGRPQLHAKLGNLHAQAKEWDLAVQELSKAIELAPEAADNRNDLGNVYYEKGEFPEAVRIYSTTIALVPGSATYHANLAGALQELKQYDAAIKEHEKAIELEPRNAERHNGLGDAFYDKEDFANAAEAYRKAIAIEPGSALYHANLVAALQKLKQFDAAIKEYEKAIEPEPSNAVRHNDLGDALYAKEDFADAAEAYRRAIAIGPGSAHYHASLAATLRKLKQFDAAVAAVKEYEKAIELEPRKAARQNDLGIALYAKDDFADAAEAYRRAIAIEPGSARYHASLAAALQKLNQYDAAIKEHEKAIELEPGNAARHIDLGGAFYEKEDFADAAEAARKAIALNPGNALYHANLAAALQKLNQYDAAIKEHEKAIELEPRNAERHNGLGDAFYDKEDFANAAEAYRKAIAIEPGSALYHANLVAALQKLKQFDAAIKEYEKAIEPEPSNAVRHNDLGDALYAKEDFADAAEAYRRAIAIGPGSAHYHASLAATLRKLKQFDAAVAAVKEYEKAVELEPRKAARQNDLGNALYAKEDFADAAEAYRKAIAIEPGSALYHASLAAALRKLEQFDAAIKQYETAIELEPKNATHHNGLGNAFFEKKDFTNAAEAYRKAIAIEPGSAVYHANLAGALQELKTRGK
jgi:tetratricopeptide (TPR) repeat protein